MTAQGLTEQAPIETVIGHSDRFEVLYTGKAYTDLDPSKSLAVNTYEVRDIQSHGHTATVTCDRLGNNVAVQQKSATITNLGAAIDDLAAAHMAIGEIKALIRDHIAAR